MKKCATMITKLSDLNSSKFVLQSIHAQAPKDLSVAAFGKVCAQMMDTLKIVVQLDASKTATGEAVEELMDNKFATNLVSGLGRISTYDALKQRAMLGMAHESHGSV